MRWRAWAPDLVGLAGVVLVAGGLGVAVGGGAVLLWLGLVCLGLWWVAGGVRNS